MVGTTRAGSADGGEVNPGHPVGEVFGHILRNRLGQAGLADPTGTSQRQERDGIVSRSARAGDLRLPPDEAGAWDGRI